MSLSELSDLLGGASEDLGVEYKAWLDTSLPEVRAKLARHIAAIANHGGGYIVVGVDDTTKLPMGETNLDRRLFTQDAVAGIARRYLDPLPQIRVEETSHEGVRYPVIVIPSHGGRPVVSIADGPHDQKERPVGIRQSEIYVRSAGPASTRIKSPDEWNTLLDRCVANRADLLANIMRQAIARPVRASSKAAETLLAATEATATDFAAQTEELAVAVDPKYAADIRGAGKAFSVLGYALLDNNAELHELDGVRALNDRVSVAMHNVAYYGWASFLPLSVPERAPQIRARELLGLEQTSLEGMRLPSTAILGPLFDYWRIYEAGIATTAQNYWEDGAQSQDGGPLSLTVNSILFRLHSLLSHARFVGQETSGVQQVLIRIDWRGLAGRTLMWDRHRVAAPGKTADGRYAKTIALPWAELRNAYFATLRRIALPFLDFFPSTGWEPPDSWLTRERVESEFAKFNFDSVRLFDD